MSVLNIKTRCGGVARLRLLLLAALALVGVAAAVLLRVDSGMLLQYCTVLYL